MLKKLAKLNALQLILLAFLITGLINISIAYFEISGLSNVRSEQKDIFFPSSRVIGIVWMLLIAGLSYSFSVVAKKNESIANHLIFLFLICVTYPFYTMGFSSFITQQYDLRKLGYNFLWEFCWGASVCLI